MTSELAVRKASKKLSADDAAELSALAGRVSERLGRTAADILAIGADLIRAKALLGHGRFGPWLDTGFALSRRSAEQFMAATRRFGTKSEAGAHLPAGAILELSAPGVPDELVARVVSGDIPPTVSAIREERASHRIDDRSFAVAGTFIDYLDRFHGTDVDYAAGIAAHVLRRRKDPQHRAWFAGCMRMAATMIEENLETKIPLLELPRTTVRKLREQRRT
jgi:hypothetical protein